MGRDNSPSVNGNWPYRKVDGSGNDVVKTLEVEREMGMLVCEWEGMGTCNPFPLITGISSIAALLQIVL